MIRIIRWAFRTFGSDTLIEVCLIWTISISISYGLATMITDLSGGLLSFVTFIAITIGWLFARSRTRAGWAWIWLTLAGIFIQYTLAAGLWSPAWILLERAFAWLPGWINHLLDPRLSLPDDRLIRLAASDLSAAGIALAQRLQLWLTGFVTGKPRFDQPVSFFLWGLALWFCAAWTAWVVRRLKSPLLAVVPGAIIFSATVNFTRQGVYWIVPILAASFLLLAFIQHREREQRWAEKGIDYSTELRSDLGILVIPLISAIMTISIAVPSLSVQGMVNTIHKWTAPQANKVEQVGRSLGLNREIQVESFSSTQRNPGLPRVHLLDAGPDLSKNPVMTVRVLGDPYSQSGKAYYWRSLTYDVYTGSGWETSAAESKTYQAGEQASPSSQPWHQLIQEQVTLDQGGEGELYAAGDLITANQDYQVAWRAPQQNGDAFGARINAQTYQARSLIPLVGVADLRAAGEVYPDWIRQRYLQLPPTVPQRVHDLAMKLVEGKDTPYDQAKAIEADLRTYPYTLDIPKPPSGVDVADYFLFDLKKGYCDYYATAMVVLARSAGIPARVVIGFASGAFNIPEQAYFVTEADAHSWVEIYFPEIGWVNFEPTAAQPTIERPDTVSQPEQQLPPMPISPQVGINRMLRDVRTWPVILGILLLVGWAGWRWFDRMRLSLIAPEKTIFTLFSRLQIRGRRIEVTRNSGETPGEYTRRMLEATRKASRVQIIGGLLRPIQEEIREIARLYEQASYSPHPVQASDRLQALHGWDRLDWRMWVIWVAKKFKLLSYN
jgi:hypothetical protein